MGNKPFYVDGLNILLLASYSSWIARYSHNNYDLLHSNLPYFRHMKIPCMGSFKKRRKLNKKAGFLTFYAV